jgi:hypothetical protein
MRELEDKGGGEAPFPIKYYTVCPNKWTFQSEKIKTWCESHLEGRVLNACAGKTTLDHSDEIVRNDLDETIPADSHVDVIRLTERYDPNTFDTIVYDPPFSDFQANVSYGGRKVGKDSAAKREFDALLKANGKVIQFGFTTTCMPGEFDYKRREVAIFNTLGRMNDWLGTVDQRMSSDLRQYE